MFNEDTEKSDDGGMPQTAVAKKWLERVAGKKNMLFSVLTVRAASRRRAQWKCKLLSRQSH
jgi:hypothetical protein